MFYNLVYEVYKVDYTVIICAYTQYMHVYAVIYVYMHNTSMHMFI